MALDGERCIIKSQMIGGPSTVVTNNSLLPNPNPGCCDDPIFDVLADASDNAIQNDVTTAVWWFNSTTTAATITLYKEVAGIWVSQGPITDNTYGTYKAFGYFVNQEGQSFIKLETSWAAILDALGAGKYKFACAYVDSILGNDTSPKVYQYCLKEYSPTLAEGTVRLEYWLQGVTEDILDDTLVKDFGTEVIYNSIRVEGYFGYQKSLYESTYIEYNNGTSKFVEDKRMPSFELELKMVHEFIHAILRTDFMMADQLAVTDYNSRNNASYVTKFVIKDSEYSPGYFQLQSNSAPVSLKFKPQSNRSRKFRV